jgi:hypothetical protein
MIGMWDGTPTSEWIVLSGVGGVFYQKWIKPANSYDSTGGASTHSHANVSNATGVSNLNTTTDNTIHDTSASLSTHMHTLVVSLQANVSNIAPYIDVIFAQLTPPPPSQMMFMT